MAVDRGGLQYRIQVQDQFSKTTQRFRSELEASKVAFQRFIQDVSGTASSVRGLKETADAARAVAQSNKALATSSRQLARARKEELTLDEKVAIAAKRAAEARAIAARADERQLDLSRSIVRQKNIEEDAQKRVAAAIRRRAVEERRLELLGKQGLDAQGRKIVKLTSEEEALKRVEVSIRKLAMAERERALLNARIQGPQISNVEQGAIDKVEKAILKRQIAERASQIAQQRGIQLEEKKVGALSVEEEALKRVAAEERRRSIQARVQAIQNDRFIGPRLPAGGTIAKDTPGLLGKIKDLLASTNREGNSLFFTFRRLFGVLALFTAARAAVSGFLNTIKEGLTFNAEVQQAQLGIASLITAVGTLRDEFGRALDPAKQLAAAQVIAGKQTAKLRQEAFKTTASFQQLLETFQTAIAPGLTGGLNLDQIREFSVQISQAAQALGLAQNQLAEEIRSILSGTIQARTTRIATALGITNEDIRRAKEANDLFGLLQRKFKAFEEAGQQAARGTFNGLFNLIKSIFSQALGQGAAPLFQKLIDLGNVLFDRVLTIRDAFGNIQPNPQLVSIFSQLFDTISGLLDELVKIGQDIGFEGARRGALAFTAVLRILGQVGIGVISGVAKSILAISGALSAISASLGVSNAQLGGFLGTVASIAVPLTLIARLMLSVGGSVVSIINLFGKLPGSVAQAGVAVRGALLLPLASAVAGVAAIGLAFQQLVQQIFDVKLSFGQVIDLFSSGFSGVIVAIAENLKVAFVSVIGFIKREFTQLKFELADFLDAVKEFKASVTGNQAELDRITRKRLDSELAKDNEIRASRLATEKEIADIRQRGADIQKGLTDQIAATIGEAATTAARGVGFAVPNFNFVQFLKSAQDLKNEFGDFLPPLSTAATQIADLADELKTVQDEARKSAAEFKNAFDRPVVEGVAGQIESIFQQTDVASSEKLKKFNAEILITKQKIATIETGDSLFISSQGPQLQAELNSLLQDEKDLLAARNQLLEVANKASISRAATIAVQELPNIKNENDLLAQRARAETAISRATRARVVDSQLDVITAQAALDTAREESSQKERQLALEIQVVRERSKSATGDEALALSGLGDQLERRLSLEQQVAQAQEQQLAFALQQAELVQNGTVTQGLREGLVQLASELPTFFEAGVTIAKNAVQAFSSFLSETIVAAFDPSSNTSFNEALGRFLQSIATTILDQLIQAAIGQLIASSLGLNVGAGELITAATTLGVVTPGLAAAASILLAAAQTLLIAKSIGGGLASGGAVGLARGGAVRTHARARGYDSGGRIKNASMRFSRPRGLDPRDVVPIWAAPGEYMQQASAVRLYGLRAMEALNRGLVDPMALSALASGVAPAIARANPGPGFAEGGLIADEIALSNATGKKGSNSGSGGLQRAVIVAGEAEFDKLISGGKSSMIRFARENKSDLRDALGVN